MPGMQRRMAERVTTSSVSWEAASKTWAGQPWYKAIKPGAAETLFVRHVAKLQQEEAEHSRILAAEVRARMHAWSVCIEMLMRVALRLWLVCTLRRTDVVVSACAWIRKNVAETIWMVFQVFHCLRWDRVCHRSPLSG